MRTSETRLFFFSDLLFGLVLIILFFHLGHSLPFLAQDFGYFPCAHSRVICGYLRTALFLETKERESYVSDNDANWSKIDAYGVEKERIHWAFRCAVGIESLDTQLVVYKWRNGK